MNMPDSRCPFCDWTGPANYLPRHVREGCDGHRDAPRKDGAGGEARTAAQPPAEETNPSRVASGGAGGPPRRMTDGGRRFLLPDVGARVLDREAVRDGGDANPAVVLATHETTTAADYHVDALDATVAELNPEWADGAPVIEVAFVDALDGAGAGWSEDPPTPDAARDANVTVYSYPAPRLIRAERVPGGGGE